MKYVFLLVLSTMLAMIVTPAWVQAAVAPVSGWRDNWGRVRGVYTSGQAVCDVLNQESPSEAPFTYHDDPTVLNGYTASGYCSSKDGFSRAAPATKEVPPPIDCHAGQRTDFWYDMGPIPGEDAFPTSDGFCGIHNLAMTECRNSSADTTVAHVLCHFVAYRNGTTLASPVPAPTTVPEQAPTAPVPGQGRSDPSQECPRGTVNIGTDSAGTPMCRGMGTVPNVPDKISKKQGTTTTQSDGVKTHTTMEEVTNSDGSTTRYTNVCTTDTAGVTTCRTSQHTTASSTGMPGRADGQPAAAPGQSGAKRADGKDGQDICALHPDLTICQNAQVIGGSCTDGVDTTSCKGDAIQCAILRQQKKEYCENRQPTPQSKLGDVMLQGTDEVGNSTLPSQSSTYTIGNIQAANGFLGASGSCFNDKTFALHGRTFTLPFSQLCDYLLALRYAIMIVALFASYRMVSGVILRGV